jgi:DNA-binding beta-propeller fold protein YncE
MIVAFALVGVSCAGRYTPPLLGVLHKRGDVRLPGAVGSLYRPSRLDEAEFDPATRRVYVAHQREGAVDVVDVAGMRVVGTVTGIPHVHALRLAADLGKLFATATIDDQVVTIDIAGLRVTGRTATGRFPDSMAYDAVHHLLIVSNRQDGSDTIIDARTGTVVRTVALGTQVGEAVYDPTSGDVLVAVDRPDELVAVDASTGAVRGHSLLPGCVGPHGVAVDGPAGVAFVACQTNHRLAMVDLHRSTQQFLGEVDGTPDGIADDPGLHRLYVAAESGVVSVFDTDQGRLRKRGQGRLERHAHSVVVDPETHEVDFPLESVGGHPTLRIMKP